MPVFERVGKIYEMRLMLDHYTGLNRGYCFVVFANSSEAKECVRQLNTYEIRKGRTLGICMSVDNCRLFVGGIPKKASLYKIIIIIPFLLYSIEECYHALAVLIPFIYPCISLHII